jgi:hypothetical protein
LLTKDRADVGVMSWPMNPRLLVARRLL